MAGQASLPHPSVAIFPAGNRHAPCHGHVRHYRRQTCPAIGINHDIAIAADSRMYVEPQIVLYFS